MATALSQLPLRGDRTTIATTPKFSARKELGERRFGAEAAGRAVDGPSQ